MPTSRTLNLITWLNLAYIRSKLMNEKFVQKELILLEKSNLQHLNNTDQLLEDLDNEWYQTITSDTSGSIAALDETNDEIPLPIVTPQIDVNARTCTSEAVASTSTKKQKYDSCYYLINEVSPSGVHDRKTFVELLRVVLDSKSTVCSLKEYKIVIIDILLMCIISIVNLHNYSFNENNLFIVPDEAFASPITIQNSESVEFLPNGLEKPYAVLLIYKSDFYTSKKWRDLNLKTRRNSIAPLHLDPGWIQLLKLSLADMVVYGYTPTSLIPAISMLESLYNDFNYEKHILRESATDLTFSRCGSLTPMDFDSFKYGMQTPLYENDCSASNFIAKEQIPHTDFKNAFETSGNPNDETIPLTDGLDEREAYLEQANGLDEAGYDFIEGETSWVTHGRWTFAEHIERYMSDLLDLNFLNTLAATMSFELVINELEKRLSTIRCKLCYEEITSHPNKYKKTWIDGFAKAEGKLTQSKYKNTYQQRKHLNSRLHKYVLGNIIREHRAKINADMQMLKSYRVSNPELYQQIANRMRAVYLMIKTNIGFVNSNVLLDFAESTGGNIGDHGRSKTSAIRIAEFISAEMHASLIHYLTSKYNPFTIILDSSTDRRTDHNMLVYIQTMEGNRMMTYLYRMIPVPQGQTAQDMFNLLVKAFESDGSRFIDFVKQCLYTFSADGAATNFGKRSGLKTKLEEYVGRPLFGVWCFSHRLQLAVRHSFNMGQNANAAIEDEEGTNEENVRLSEITASSLGILEELLAETYRFFNTPKRAGLLREVQEALGASLAATKKVLKLFTIRWIASEYKTIMRIRELRSAIVEALFTIQRTTKNFHERNQAQKLREKFQDRHLMALLYFIEDVCEILNYWSLNLQREDSLYLGMKSLKKSYQEKLANLKNFNGDKLSLFLRQVSTSTTPVLSNRITLSQLDEEEELYFEGQRLDATHLVENVQTIGPILLDELNRQLENYFSDEELDFSIFDPVNFPETLQDLNENYPSHLEFANYGGEQLEEILSKLQMDMGLKDMEDVVLDWFEFVKQLVSSPLWQYYRSIQSPSEFWTNLLDDTSLPWTLELRFIVKLVLSIPNGSVLPERGFSQYNVVLSNLKLKLSPKHLEDFLRIRINGRDDINEFDAGRYADAWIESGKTKQGTSESQSSSSQNQPGPSGTQSSSSQNQPRPSVSQSTSSQNQPGPSGSQSTSSQNQPGTSESQSSSQSQQGTSQSQGSCSNRNPFYLFQKKLGDGDGSALF